MVRPHSGGRYFDGTLGSGGHTRALLEASAPGGQVAATDLDAVSLGGVREALSAFAERLHLFEASFTQIDRVCLLLGWEDLDGIVLDLGLSSAALDDPVRGFSFAQKGPLDMRFSQEATLSAHQVVNTYSEQALRDIIRRFGEERMAARIAHRIVASRPIETTTALAEIVAAAIPHAQWPAHIHPATKTFQAIRMEVNSELDRLAEVLAKGVRLLKPGGVMAVISYHSLEDRLVKRCFQPPSQAHLRPKGLPPQADTAAPRLSPLFRKPLVPHTEEVQLNPRSRSARLRAARRIA